MNVDALQAFVRNTGELLFSSEGKKIPAEFDQICLALEPFRGQKVTTFGEFLARVSEEFVRTGLVTLPSGTARKPSGKTVSPKPRTRTKQDVQDITSEAARLTALYNRATDPLLGYPEITQEVERIAKTFDKDGLIAVAREFGVQDKLSSKKDAQEKIRLRIANRKGSFNREASVEEEEVVVEVSEA